jgi:hypothetical protein
VVYSRREKALVVDERIADLCAPVPSLEVADGDTDAGEDVTLKE